MNNINITVVGPTNSGKSSVLYLIKTLLREHKFTVIGDGGVDFVDEQAFDEQAQRGINAKLDAIKKRTKITITEKQNSSFDVPQSWELLTESRPKIGQKCWVCDEDNNVFIARYIEQKCGFLWRKTRQGFVSVVACGWAEIQLIEKPIKWQPLIIPKP